MSPIKYYTNIRLGKDSKTLRYQLIRYALQNGVKPAARIFHTTPKTVRKWLCRWRQIPDESLIDRRTLPKNRPSKIPAAEKLKAIELKGKYQSWGAMKIKNRFGLKISDKAIRKIWREEGLATRRRQIA